MNGRAFNIGDDVHGDVICQESCKCTKYEGYDAGIICAFGECFEEYDPNCIMTYKDVKHCCSTAKICGKISLIISIISLHSNILFISFWCVFFYPKIDKEQIRSLNTCEVDGYIYYDGQLIFPNDRAYRCRCAPNYNNATSYADNPNCVRKDGCGLQLDTIQTQYLRKGCVPVYYERPDNCPSNTDYTCREF